MPLISSDEKNPRFTGVSTSSMCMFGMVALALMVFCVPARQAMAQKPTGELMLPRPNDLRIDETSMLVDPEPRGFGLLGCTMRIIDPDEAGNPRRLLAGRAFKVLEFTEGTDGDWTVTNVIDAPEDCGNPGNFGTKFDVDGDYLGVLPMDRSGKGGVHVYRRKADGWERTQLLLHSNLPEGTRYHGRIVMEDGLMCIYDREGVTIYRRTPTGVYTLDALLVAENEADRDRFGRSVAIEGDLIAVTLFRAKAVSEEVRFFKKGEKPGEWIHQSTIKPTDGIPGSWFGEHMALEKDELVVASPKWDIAVGKVDIFRPDADGNWKHAQELKVKPDSLSSFGTTLHLGESHLVVGASMPKIPGSAYVFEKGPEGGYTRVCMLGRPEADINDGFAMQVNIIDETILVSSPFERVGETGRAGVLRFYALDKDEDPAGESEKSQASEG